MLFVRRYDVLRRVTLYTNTSPQRLISCAAPARKCNHLAINFIARNVCQRAGSGKSVSSGGSF